MPFLFILRRSATEDNGEETPAFIVHIFMSALYIGVLLISCCAAWMQRTKRTPAIQLYYGLIISCATVNTGLYVYRANQRVGGMCSVLMLFRVN